MKIIYVAGPYRADGWHNVWENIMAARAAAREAWKLGWAVICPHANSIFMDGPDITDLAFLAGDLEIVRRCDAMLMLPGWEQSVGARGEHALAEGLGLPIYYSIASVPRSEP